MRLRALTLPQKSLIFTAAAATTLGIIAAPASAITVRESSAPASATAAQPGPVHAVRASDGVISIHPGTSVSPSGTQSSQGPGAAFAADTDVAFFISAARGAINHAKGKVSTSDLQVQIGLLEQASTMQPGTIAELTEGLRAMTADTGERVVKYDKEQARKKAAAKKAAEERARKQEAERKAAEQRAAEQRAQQQREAQQNSGSQKKASAPAPASVDSGASAGGNSPAAARAFAKSYMASTYGWGGDQFACLNSLFNRESGWNYHASNPSGAYGIPQALPGSKMGAGWQNNATVQVKWGLSYIKSRYGTPCGAWGHSQSTGWY